MEDPKIKFTDEQIQEARRRYQKEWRAKQDPDELKRKEKTYRQRNKDKIKQWQENFWRKVAESNEVRSKPEGETSNNNIKREDDKQ